MHSGIQLLLEIGAARPELLLTGKALTDQGRVVTVMLESGWTRTQLRHVIAGRPPARPGAHQRRRDHRRPPACRQASPTPATLTRPHHPGDALDDEPPAHRAALERPSTAPRAAPSPKLSPTARWWSAPAAASPAPPPAKTSARPASTGPCAPPAPAHPTPRPPPQRRPLHHLRHALHQPDGRKYAMTTPTPPASGSTNPLRPFRQQPGRWERAQARRCATAMSAAAVSMPRAASPS
ncbi:hypothetical protein LV779_21825 [Streptomyces thinghirensis]|nr:hypothetical protein [Streptomyces thinghirensis]